MTKNGNIPQGRRAALFFAMVNCSSILIETQRLEESAGDSYHRHPTPEGLAKWKAVRRQVERLAEDYVAAIRKWREVTETEIAESIRKPSARVYKPPVWCRWLGRLGQAG